MRQIVQSLRTGVTDLVESPCPVCRSGHLLIQTHCSLISVGTERSLLEFGRSGWLGKIRSQPDKVRQVIDKIKTDGVIPTLQSVRAKLDQPLPLGYCNFGTVLEVGENVEGFEPGDRVVSNGHHAEVVCVPKNLCAKVPQDVTDEQAAFTVAASIGLQGIRLAQPTLGETIVVTGLGLIGLLTVQLLRAHGCRVLGIDFDSSRLKLAQSFGAETINLSQGDDPAAVVDKFTDGQGVDAVIITAATKSNEPIHQATQVCRKRGRIVLVGVAGMAMSRADFYEKELSFQVSCSYGPGRYDPSYEQAGRDYPVEFVRWTQQRNFEAVLDAMSSGSLDPQPLISHRFQLDDVGDAYELVDQGDRSALGVLIKYASDEASALRRQTIQRPAEIANQPSSNAPRIGFLGAGAFACHTLIPNFRKHGTILKSVAAHGGLSAALAARRFGFQSATSDSEQILGDPEIDAIVVATRHDSHARYVCRALSAGKHVYVEKPLALTHDDIERVRDTLQNIESRQPAPVLMVGLNRRFAPHVCRIAKLLSGVCGPKSFVMTVNAGIIPIDSWVHDPQSGGGRIVGEACHFIDLLRHLVGCPIVEVQASLMEVEGADSLKKDTVSITLRFADGSIGTVHYLSNGHKGFPKERLEVFCDRGELQLDNFRRLKSKGFGQLTSMKRWVQDKGHSSAMAAFIDAVVNRSAPPIPVGQLLEVARVSVDAVRAAETGETVLYGGGVQTAPAIHDFREECRVA